MLSLNIILFFLVSLAMTKKHHWDKQTFDEWRAAEESELGKATDLLIFGLSADDFQEHRQRKEGPPEVDWKADGCTSSDDTPLGYKFKNSCDRHDFALSNYKKQGRLTKKAKKRIDKNFRKDLKDQCKKEKHQGRCRSMADIYYAGVRAFGKRESLAGRIDLASLKVEDSDNED
ncbi:hypothetical protein NX059_009344 [Plenodomus lindquistii]|nr:hypothetical protein NX059_009344 [Plenodomus lindquistii]